MTENTHFRAKRTQYNDKGFTLIELMISVAITGLILGGIFAIYNAQHKTYQTQGQVAGMQQNLRSAMYFIERDIRPAGLEQPDGSGNKSGSFGISGVRYLDLNGNTIDQTINFNIINFASIQFSSDANNNHFVDAGEAITYSVFDANGDGNFDLAWDNGTGTQMMAENIEVMAFAYAYDNDDDGELDYRDIDGNPTFNPENGEYVVWAIDTNNDNFLDFDLNTNQDVDANQTGLIDWQDLDFNGDNVIDTNDDINGDGDVDVADFLAAGGATPVLPQGSLGAGGVPVGAVALTSIRSVRIWLMARTDRQNADDSTVDTTGINGNDPYSLGDRAVVPALDPNIPDDFKRRVLTTIIYCRNL